MADNNNNNNNNPIQIMQSIDNQISQALNDMKSGKATVGNLESRIKILRSMKETVLLSMIPIDNFKPTLQRKE